MGEAVMYFLVERLSDLLNEEDEENILHGVRKPVEEIITEMRQLQVSLTDAGARRNQEHVRAWAADVRNLAYDATDILEHFIITIASKRRAEKRSLMTSIDERLVLHNMRSEMKSIKRRISELEAVFQTLGVTSKTKRQLIPLDRTNYSPYQVVADQEVIGLERDIEYLVGHLVNDNEKNEGHVSCYQFVSIIGMGGLGKTTLARKIYNHPAITRSFDSLVWICISQQWQIIDVLRQIFLKLCPGSENKIHNVKDKDELALKISSELHGKNYLIVLDDIWSTDVWSYLKAAFPFENNSSKILFTTRKVEVAQQVGLDCNLVHEPKLLNDEQSWELLQRKTCVTKYQHTGKTLFCFLILNCAAQSVYILI